MAAAAADDVATNYTFSPKISARLVRQLRFICGQFCRFICFLLDVGPIDRAGAALQRQQQSGPLRMLTIGWLLIDPHQMQTDDSRSRDPPSSGCNGPPFSVGFKSPITFITTSLEIITPWQHLIHRVFWPLSSADVHLHGGP
jgi:hypothetical protein